MSESGNSSVPLLPKFSDLRDHYALFRDYMKHEDDLINQRTTWHGVIQGLLLTAFGWLLQWKSDSLFADQMHSVRAAMSYALPIVGIFVAIFGFLSCLAANRAIDKLFKAWQDVPPLYPAPLPKLPGIAGAGSKPVMQLGKLPSLGIPFLMAVVWVWVFVNVCKDHPFHDIAPQTVSAPQSAKGPDSSVKSIQDSLYRLDELEARLRKDGFITRQTQPNTHRAKPGHIASHQ